MDVGAVGPDEIAFRSWLKWWRFDTASTLDTSDHDATTESLAEIILAACATGRTSKLAVVAAARLFRHPITTFPGMIQTAIGCRHA